MSVCVVYLLCVRQNLMEGEKTLLRKPTGLALTGKRRDNIV